VPVLAVLEFNGKAHLTKKLDGRFSQSEIELGLSNEKFVEIKKGAKEGEIVAMSPVSLMTEEEKRAAFGSAGKATLRDWSKEESAEAAAAAKAAGAAGAAGVPGQGNMAGGGPEGKGKASGKARTKGAGGGRPAWMTNLSDEERTVFRTGTDEEKKELMKAKGGMNEEQAEEALERMKSFGGGGGRGGPGGGRGRGGMGGGPPGGGDGGSNQ
jgi:HlyD family secretion protein